MAFYTNTVATKIIDPQFNKSMNRSEFRIKDMGLYGSNMRIMNLGVIVSAPSLAADRAYNKLAGCYGTIENIYLYDGKVVLDQVLDYKDYGAFVQYNNSNNKNCDTIKMLSKSGLGFVYDSDAFNVAGQLTVPRVKEFNPANGGHFPGISDETTPTGYLDLRSVFPLLKQLDFIHTKLFPNLRVVIEYKMTNILTTNSNAGAVVGTTMPILVVDQFMNEKLANEWLNSFKQVVWNAIELETVQVPSQLAVAVAGEQKIKFRLNGFANKTVGNILLQKKPTTSVSTLYGTLGSETMLDERVQVYVNNSAIIPNDGVQNPNHRLALLTQTFGNCNAHACSANLCMYKADTQINQWDDRVGSTDYFGIAIGKKVSELDVEFSRTVGPIADTSAQYLQALSLNVFGSVVKAIIKVKDSYQVLYL